MNRIVRSLALVGFVLLGAAGALAQQTQQDTTVDWKLSLQDLETRLAALPGQGAADVDSWRGDAENLRTDLASSPPLSRMHLRLDDRAASDEIDQFQDNSGKAAVVNP